MSLNKARIWRRPSRGVIAILAGVVAIATLTVITEAQTRPDEQDLMRKRLDAFEELFAPHFATVDRMSDGLLRTSIAARLEAANAGDEFIEFLEEDPDGAAEYRQLLFSAVRREEDWSGVFIVGTAPPRFLLDTWIDATRPGGEFRDEFLERMADRDVDRNSGVWDVVEEQHPGYALHKDYMRMHSVEEAAPLIEYMLRTNPLQAMDILLDIYPDQLPDAEPVFDDHWTIKKTDWKYDHGMHRGRAPHETLVALTRLSHHDVWWVRLYAVSAMNKRGPFRLEHRLEALHDDPSEPVSRAAKAISPPKDQRGKNQN